MSVWLVVNPRAGSGRGARYVAELLPHLHAEGIEPIVHVCASGEEAEPATRSAIDQGAEVVVAVGGDGHASAVAQALVGSRTRLAVVATGSANDYARALGLKGRDMAILARLIAGPASHAVDVIRAETAAGVHHVLTVGGTGFDAIVAGRAQGITRLRGAPRYVAAILAELPAFAGAGFTIEVDGERLEQPALLVAVANGRTYGGGMRVAPAAHLQSGLLEICIVGQLSRVGFMRAFPSVFRGTHVRHPRVTMLRGREVAITADREMPVVGDGEILGSLPATFSVLPRALNVVAPPGAPLA